jgi:seryl-tRNA synthetase
MPYSLEKKARTLVDASLKTDREAAEKNDVSRKSIQRWRKDLRTDEELQARFAELWETVREAEDWAEDATDTIRTACSFLRTAFEDLDPSDPEAVEAVTKALRTLAEASMVKDAIDVRIQQQQGAGSVHATHRKN